MLLRMLPEELKKVFAGVISDEYNTAPKGFREITEGEFAQSMFFTYSPERMDYAQFTKNYDGTPLNEKYALCCKVFFMHDGTGFCMSHDYWGKKVRYFRFGCSHKYRSFGREEAQEKGWPYTGGNCCHNDVCEICGHVRFIDSSD